VNFHGKYHLAKDDADWVVMYVDGDCRNYTKGTPEDLVTLSERIWRVLASSVRMLRTIIRQVC